MSKKLISSVAIVALLAVSMTSASVFAAEDDIMPINETSEAMPISETAGEISEPEDSTTSDETVDLEEGTAPIDDKAEEIDDEDEEGEPEMWPMYVSLGALGVAVLVFIILNLFGRKKR